MNFSPQCGKYDSCEAQQKENACSEKKTATKKIPLDPSKKMNITLTEQENKVEANIKNMFDRSLPPFDLDQLLPLGKIRRIIIWGGRRCGKTTLVGRIRVALSLPRTTIVSSFSMDAQFYSRAFFEEESSPPNIAIFVKFPVQLLAEYLDMHKFVRERSELEILLCDMLNRIRVLAHLILFYLQPSFDELLVLEEVDEMIQTSHDFPRMLISCDPGFCAEKIGVSLIFMRPTSPEQLQGAYKRLADFVALSFSEFQRIYETEIGYDGHVGSFLVVETKTGILSCLEPMSSIPNHWLE
jgi:hypothetical protein